MPFMAKNIFFSWQSDTPNKVGRNFLKDVLEEVVASDTTLDEADREVVVDSDTQGVAGQPPIVDTIFRKIDASAVFVADMTFTGTRIDKKKRPTPNPNVLIEYGWALKSLANERVICVMNTAYGEPSHETLPFDLSHLRWPIGFNLPEGATPQVRAEEKVKLVKILKEAIRLSLGTLPVEVAALPPSFQPAESTTDPARFRSLGEAIGFEDDDFGFGDAKKKEVYLTAGPAMWLRLMPSINPQKTWPTHELKKYAVDNSQLMPLIHPAGGYSYLRASDGEGIYRAGGSLSEGESIQVDAVAFAFKTGEVWSIETALFSYSADRLYSTEVEKIFVEGIERYSQFLKALGVDYPYHWKAGLIGMRGRQLSYAPPPGKQWIRDRGPICAADLIEAEGQIESGQTPTTALLPFFEKIFDECGTARPEYLPQ
jgi:hypothetical protein